MRICLVSLDCFSMRSSGLAVYAETLASGLASLGHDVTVVSASRPGQPAHERVNGVEIVRVPIGRWDWISFAWQAGPTVSHLAETAGFDVVHFLDVHFAYRYRGQYIASLFQSFRQRATSQGGLPSHSGLKSLVSRMLYYRAACYLFEKPTLARAVHLLPASQATLDEFRDHYGVLPERMTVVPLGVDLCRFTPAQDASLREQLGLANAFVLLYVGHGTPRKGLEFLARAFCMLPTDTRLVLVGRWEAAYRARFVSLLGDAADRVTLAGYVSDQDLPRYYHMADLFVFPSLLEGFGLPLVEALAAGLPVVTTMGSSAPEVVGPGGLLVPPGNAPALVDAIQQFIEDPRLGQRMASSGREWVLSRFALTRMVHDTMSQYEQWSSSASQAQPR